MQAGAAHTNAVRMHVLPRSCSPCFTLNAPVLSGAFISASLTVARGGSHSWGARQQASWGQFIIILCGAHLIWRATPI